jgi:hypothetical protein
MDITKLPYKIGSTAYLKLDGLRVEVKIVSAKVGWGELRYLVTPVSGSLEKWVSMKSLVNPNTHGVSIGYRRLF